MHVLFCFDTMQYRFNNINFLQILSTDSTYHANIMSLVSSDFIYDTPLSVLYATGCYIGWS